MCIDEDLRGGKLAECIIGKECMWKKRQSFLTDLTVALDFTILLHGS